MRGAEGEEASVCMGVVNAEKMGRGSGGAPTVSSMLPSSLYPHQLGKVFHAPPVPSF